MSRHSQDEAQAIAKALLSVFSHREIRNFLDSNPMEISIADCRQEIAAGGGQVLFWLPQGGFADLESLLEQSSFDQEMMDHFLAHPDCARLSWLFGREENLSVLTLTRSPELLENRHTENLLWGFLHLSGCRDLEALENGILDAAEAANLVPEDLFLR